MWGRCQICTWAIMTAPYIPLKQPVLSENLAWISYQINNKVMPEINGLVGVYTILYIYRCSLKYQISQIFVYKIKMNMLEVNSRINAHNLHKVWWQTSQSNWIYSVQQFCRYMHVRFVCMVWWKFRTQIFSIIRIRICRFLVFWNTIFNKFEQFSYIEQV